MSIVEQSLDFDKIFLTKNLKTIQNNILTQ